LTAVSLIRTIPRTHRRSSIPHPSARVPGPPFCLLVVHTRPRRCTYLLLSLLCHTAILTHTDTTTHRPSHTPSHMGNTCPLRTTLLPFRAPRRHLCCTSPPQCTPAYLPRTTRHTNRPRPQPYPLPLPAALLSQPRCPFRVLPLPNAGCHDQMSPQRR
jgi:hypothetical protein